MRYHALACDYDGTIAAQGTVAPETRDALGRLRASGRRLLLVTGRRLDDLAQACPDLSLFDCVVAENGAVLLEPTSREPRVLAAPPPEALLASLRAQGVAPLDRGAVIVATRQPHELEVFEAIRALGLELQVTFNKGAVMVLPSGVNKASGLLAALTDLRLSPHDVVGIGDGENDHAFLTVCELAVAVADAVPSLRQTADATTGAPGPAGVRELVAALLADDAAALAPRPDRHQITIGDRDGGGTLAVSARGGAILCAGTSGGGKSTLVTGFLERLAEQKYQACVIDPEGDYGNVDPRANERAVVLGSAVRAPSIDEVMAALASPQHDVAVNLLDVPLDDRPRFFAQLFPKLVELRAQLGRPHWIVIDEAHHLLARGWQPSFESTAGTLEGLLLVTVHPEHLPSEILRAVTLVLAVGREPQGTLEATAKALSIPPPASVLGAAELEAGEALAWAPGDGRAPVRVRTHPPQVERQRHARKYAQGELAPDESFYFRGPDGRLNLRAQNLRLFLQVADGVDEATWFHHLRRGDYSRWIRSAVKDPDLAAAVAAIERDAGGSGTSAVETRARLRRAIEDRYTASS